MDTQPAAAASQPMDPREAVLRHIAQAAPRSWFPRAFAKQRNADLNYLFFLLELLQLDGLIERGESDPDAGPGVVLTRAGQALLGDTAKLERLRRGEPLIPGDRGGEVRRVLTMPPVGLWSRVLFWANVLVLVYACYLAWPVKGLLQAYLFAGLGGVPLAVHKLILDVGGLDPSSFLAGEYWRLITATFVHLGLLHLAFNMWMMSGTARITESMWGGWRFLLIYFIAGFASTTMSLTIGAVGGVGAMCGASGALCGVLAAEAMWFWLNRAYLPRSAYRRFVGIFIVNAILLTVISLLPGVGGLGHLAGVVFGALAALFLHFQRYGLKPLRAPALACALLLPVLASVALAYAPTYNPAWIPAENRYYRYGDPEAPQANSYLPDLDARNEEKLLPLLNKGAARRNADDTKAALASIATWRTELHDLETTFARSRYSSPTIQAYRTATLTLVRAWLVYLAEGQRCLEAEEKWTHADTRQLEAVFDELTTSERAWNKERNSWPSPGRWVPRQ